MVRIMPEFLMGLLAYKVEAEFSRANLAFLASVTLLAALILAMAPDAIIVVVFVAIIISAAAAVGQLKAALSWPPLVYLGEMSYSLYLVHALVLSMVYGAFKLPFLAKNTPAATPDWLFLVLVIPVGCLLFHLVERPGRIVVRRIFGRALFKKPHIEIVVQ